MSRLAVAVSMSPHTVGIQLWMSCRWCAPPKISTEINMLVRHGLLWPLVAHPSIGCR